MANPSGAKGTKWETAVVQFLVECGLRAKRKARHGAFDKADIEVPQLEDLLVIEAKNWKTAGLAGWIDETLKEAENAGVPIGACWHHRPRQGSPGRGYVTMQGDHFAALLLEIVRLRGLIEQAGHRIIAASGKSMGQVMRESAGEVSGGEED